MSRVGSNEMTLQWLFADSAAIELNKSTMVTGLTLDSRRINPGNVYFALKGQAYHGLDFLDQVLDAGIIAVVIDVNDAQLIGRFRDKAAAKAICIIEIKNLANTVGCFAARYYQNNTDELQIIGVTGTDGKTSVAQFIANALQYSGRPSGVMGTNGWGCIDNINRSNMTTHDPIETHRQLSEMRKRGARYICMEVSSHALEQGRVSGVCFHLAVLTNLARDHLDYHGTVENYSRAKKRLFNWKSLTASVINADDKLGMQLISASSSDHHILSYSVDRESNYKAEEVVVNNRGLEFRVKTKQRSVLLKSDLVGEFNIYNLLATYAVLEYLGLTKDEIVSAIGSLQAVEGRIERFQSNTGPVVVVDFAHTPQALESVLRSLKGYCEGELWCVFGCGGDRDRGKRSLMGRIAEEYADHIVVTNDNPRTEDPQQIARDVLSHLDADTRVEIILDRRRAISTAVHNAGADDWILVAGKGHENYQIIGSKRIPFSDRQIVKDMLAGPVK